MSTKNLARTVIEGGRCRYNQWERRHSSRVDRKHVRAALRSLLLDPEGYEDLALPLRQPVGRCFDDRLGPAYRFLTSRVGKSWNRTHALLRERFDSRTTAGRHILFDHLLRDVTFTGEDHHSAWISRRGRFVVDERGVLTKFVRVRRRRPLGAKPRPLSFRLRLTKRETHEKAETQFLGRCHMSSKTLVLTPWYFPYKIVGWQDAITLVYLEKVDVVVQYDEVIRSPSTAIRLPAVVRMKRAVKTSKRRVKLSRVNVYMRDGFACAYCNAKLTMSEATYDHVVPRAQGGRTVWENILTACTSCNTKKGNRTPAQAGMRPLKKPYRPVSLPLPPPFIDVGKAPPEWHDYAAMLPAVGTA